VLLFLHTHFLIMYRKNRNNFVLEKEINKIQTYQISKNSVWRLKNVGEIRSFFVMK